MGFKGGGSQKSGLWGDLGLQTPRQGAQRAVQLPPAHPGASGEVLHLWSFSFPPSPALSCYCRTGSIDDSFRTWVSCSSSLPSPDYFGLLCGGLQASPLIIWGGSQEPWWLGELCGGRSRDPPSFRPHPCFLASGFALLFPHQGTPVLQVLLLLPGPPPLGSPARWPETIFSTLSFYSTPRSPPSGE